MQFEFYTKIDRLKYALRVPPAETRLTVYRRFEISGLDQLYDCLLYTSDAADE